MKIVIDIPDEYVEQIKNNTEGATAESEAVDAIRNGIPYEERPQGEWKLDDTEQFCYCSNCENTYYPRTLDPSWYYCPHCGADMRKGGANNG